MQRRDFLKTSLAVSAVALSSTTASAGVTTQPIDTQEVSKVAFPEKRPLITYSNRPPLLETPRDGFTKSITPNDEFFVRWHTPKIPTHIEIDEYRITINGLVETPLFVSLKNLKSDYEQVTITAVMQCGGNSRSAFKPITSGIQWGHGAMGCAKFKGVRLNDILKKAALKKEAAWINFNGGDTPAFYKAPSFARELELHEIKDDVIIAYEMNDEDLPFLNGYPVRLIIPGAYADSWVKMIENITVTSEYKELFFMDTAYRIPDNECECETDKTPAQKTKPITTMNVKSIIGYPTTQTLIHANSNVTLKGVAFDAGSGIKEVFISLDSGGSWERATLEKELSPFAFRAFSFKFRPKNSGRVTLMAKAVNTLGQEQPFAKEIQWNHGGYKYNAIDSVTIEVI
jgi:sulfoxide reductase catalytic subunit YedY